MHRMQKTTQDRRESGAMATRMASQGLPPRLTGEYVSAWPTCPPPNDDMITMTKVAIIFPCISHIFYPTLLDNKTCLLYPPFPLVLLLLFCLSFPYPILSFDTVVVHPYLHFQFNPLYTKGTEADTIFSFIITIRQYTKQKRLKRNNMLTSRWTMRAAAYLRNAQRSAGRVAKANHVKTNAVHNSVHNMKTSVSLRVLRAETMHTTRIWSAALTCFSMEGLTASCGGLGIEELCCEEDDDDTT